ncbi:hypothetical protein IT072_02365 [Leifsonia sp. ZF2019]|nr:hypothetical protein IT072_13690 [Leifsonia sp. ZF2019]UAJ79941.1 hypothetical protein IT072_02365 [Leifsonia sp. ZF2019]
MVGGVGLGKIAELRQIWRSHEAEFVFELRRGGLTLEDIYRIPEETAAYITVAASLPESPLHAAIHGWDYPLSREGMLLLDLLDLQGAKGSKKNQWKPLPRPWQRPERLGYTELTYDEAIDLLRKNAGR